MRKKQTYCMEPQAPQVRGFEGTVHGGPEFVIVAKDGSTLSGRHNAPIKIDVQRVSVEIKAIAESLEQVSHDPAHVTGSRDG